MSKRSTLVQKDEDARKDKLVSTAGEIFNTPEIKAHGGNGVWYDELIGRKQALLHDRYRQRSARSSIQLA
jgi:hypothetical protein